MRRVLRGYRDRSAKSWEPELGRAATLAFWFIFCTCLYLGAAFWTILAVGAYVAFLGLLDLRSSWGQPGANFSMGRGIVRYLGGTAVMTGCVMLEKQLSVPFALRLLILGTGVLLVHHLLQELVLGALFNARLGRFTKRIIVFSLCVFYIERDRLKAWAGQTLERAGERVPKEAVAYRLEALRARGAEVRALLSPRTPRTFP